MKLEGDRVVEINSSRTRNCARSCSLEGMILRMRTRSMCGSSTNREDAYVIEAGLGEETSLGSVPRDVRPLGSPMRAANPIRGLARRALRSRVQRRGSQPSKMSFCTWVFQT